MTNVNRYQDIWATTKANSSYVYLGLNLCMPAGMQFPMRKWYNCKYLNILEKLSNYFLKYQGNLFFYNFSEFT